MLAPVKLPEKYVRWNEEHGAPFGRGEFGATVAVPHTLAKYILPHAVYSRMRGPFAIQPNNSTRAFEYPWAFYATPITTGLRALEIGGGLSGFQFVLDKLGCQVVNVDPGMEATGVGWPCDAESMGKLNQLFKTSVELRNTTITQADLGAATFDRAYSISVLEHLPDNEIEDVMHIVFECLRPGGYFILTVDLFLDIAPFTSRESNMYGKNVNVKWLVERAPFVLEHGNPSELYGFAEFDVDHIQSNLTSYLIGVGYPNLTQCIVLKKPDQPAP